MGSFSYGFIAKNRHFIRENRYSGRFIDCYGIRYFERENRFRNRIEYDFYRNFLRSDYRLEFYSANR